MVSASPVHTGIQEISSPVSVGVLRKQIKWDFQWDAKCTFMPKTQFSRGACTLCSVAIPTSSASPEQENLDWTPAQTAVRNSQHMFPVRQSKCAGGWCNRYLGSSADCWNWCGKQADSFLNNDWKMHYMPRTMSSHGHCSVSGNTDPCKGPI
ncbi:hypothetical protein P9112_009766 [Eukaryota sp. TZLM1-RC]